MRNEVRILRNAARRWCLGYTCCLQQVITAKGCSSTKDACHEWVEFETAEVFNFQLNLGKPIETLVVLSNEFCLICSLQTAESLYILPITLICNGG